MTFATTPIKTEFEKLLEECLIETDLPPIKNEFERYEQAMEGFDRRPRKPETNNSKKNETAQQTILVPKHEKNSEDEYTATLGCAIISLVICGIVIWIFGWGMLPYVGIPLLVICFLVYFGEVSEESKEGTPGTRYCTNCGRSIAKQEVACISCGAEPMGHKKFCGHCGISLNPEQVICVKCKNAIETASKMKDKGNEKQGNGWASGIFFLLLILVLWVTPLGLQVVRVALPIVHTIGMCKVCKGSGYVTCPICGGLDWGPRCGTCGNRGIVPCEWGR